MTQNAINQSYFSILKPAELVDQISLLVCLFLHLFHHFMRMTNFFLKFEYGSLRDCSGGHKHKKNLTYHSPQRARAFWVIFAHFCAFNFYFPLFLKNDLTFSYEILKRFSWCYSEGHYTHTQKRNSQHSPLCRVSF